MKNYKNETSFVFPVGLKFLVNKTDINIMIFTLIFVDNCLQFDAKNDFSVYMRTVSNPADINWFRSHTGIQNRYLLFFFVILIMLE